MKQRIEELAAIAAPSGREQPVRAYLLDALAKNPAELSCSTDRLGNLLVDVKGKARPKKRVLFAAHMDEVGLMIRDITEDGYLRFVTVGGIDPRVLLGRQVLVNGHVGVIGCKAVHLATKEERRRVPEADTLLIDIGAHSREQAEEVVKVGDVAVFDSDFTALGGDLFKAKALDDRAGCALLLALLQEVPPYDFTVAFTVQEEIGLRGAQTAAFAVQPDIAVVVDATTAADTVGVPTDRQVCHVGGGAVVSFMDRRTLYDHELYTAILRLAAQHGLRAQPKTMVAGGNDAGAIQTTGAGARVAAVSLPCRYIHSPSCVLSERDCADTLSLLRLLAETLPAGELV